MIGRGRGVLANKRSATHAIAALVMRNVRPPKEYHVICRLCKDDHNLKNSHVIPEFFYKPIYDSKHHLLMRKAGKLVQTRPLQKGIREKLLCEGCEQQLGRNEKYVREVLFGGTEISMQRFPNKLVLSHLDYAKVRLFFLSLIWRMSVASEHAMWKNINLGPHEEPIRLMVHNENAGEPWEYGFLCILPFFDGKFVEDWILEPDWVRNDRGRLYRLIVGGCVYLFHISKHRLAKHVSERLIQKDGSWVISFKDARKMPFIRREAERVFDAMRSEARSCENNFEEA
jgi:hypothetical protein